jgi:hypothetical protein
MMNPFVSRQAESVVTGQSARSLKVRTSLRVGYQGRGSGGGGWVPMPTVPQAPYLPQGSACSVPQKAYGDGFTGGFNDSPRR